LLNAPGIERNCKGRHQNSVKLMITALPKIPQPLAKPSVIPGFTGTQQP
jgi:hypothetical protein